MKFGRTKGKINNKCKKCDNERSRIYRMKNKEKIKNYCKSYRENNKEKEKMRHALYNQNNNEKIKIRQSKLSKK